MTTMNKVPYCLDNIRTIAEDSGYLRELLDVMYVIDQGSDRLRDHAGELDPLQETLGEQLQIIEQGNIGGSGGFSRGHNVPGLDRRCLDLPTPPGHRQASS